MRELHDEMKLNHALDELTNPDLVSKHTTDLPTVDAELIRIARELGCLPRMGVKD